MGKIKRSKCIYENRAIGIESVYNIIDGKQINIPGVVEKLRRLGREKKLFCDCGCGRNLRLVASDKNIKTQHFREIPGTGFRECETKEESKRSIDSKIILKCWLEDKLKHEDIECRVPICDVSDYKRKFEYTFISRSNRIAVSYTGERENLISEKIKLLKENDKTVRVFFIVDCSNYGSNEQYPEYMNKIQNEQGYCLFLSICDREEYYKARFQVAFSYKDYRGLWKEESVANDFLYKYTISEGQIEYEGKSIEDLVRNHRDRIADNDRIQADLAEKNRAEEERRRLEEEQKKLEEFEACRNECVEKQKKYDALTEIQKATHKTDVAEKIAAFEEFKLKSDFDQQDTPIVWTTGVRYKKCIKCGKVLPADRFLPRGVSSHKNKGICKTCV